MILLYTGIFGISNNRKELIMMKLNGTLEASRLLDKLNLEKDVDWTYDWNSNLYTITDEGESKFPPKSDNDFWDYFNRAFKSGKLSGSSSRGMTLAATEVDTSELVFTPASLLDIISKIDELSQYEVGLTTTLDGQLQLQVGDSVYDLTSESDVNNINVDDSVVDDVSEINEDAYDQIVSEEGEETQPIESGLIKEMIKTLAIGGVVRLGKNYLTSQNA